MKRTMLAMFLVMGVTVAAQEGAATLPKNYRVQFENAWVKVTAVRYEPLQKLPGHTHTANPAAYVYLNDGPPVVFRHVGGSAATRAATKAGTFRVYRGLEEVHEVENTGNAPSEFLRVELKTQAIDPAAFRGKFERPAAAGAPIVHFDHPQVRITRLWLQPGQPVAIQGSSEPSLLIALATGGGFKAGQEQWVPASTPIRLSNSGTLPIDFLRFELKTPAQTAR
jgi:hypothetical protein